MNFSNTIRLQIVSASRLQSTVVLEHVCKTLFDSTDSLFLAKGYETLFGFCSPTIIPP